MMYSVIVMLEEESIDFSEHIQSIHHVFSSRGIEHEIVIISNGLEDYLRRELKKLQIDGYTIKAFSLNKRTSQAVCLKAAFNESEGDIILACGSYQQITEESYFRLLDALETQHDIVSPWRQGRVDPYFNQLQSKVFNRLVKWVTGTHLNDLSCTVKIFRRVVLEETKLYGNMYRFLPIIAGQKGFRSIEVPCDHFQEKGRTGFYSFSMYLERVIDILTVYFNTRFTRKPLRFFSAIGALFALLGLIVLFVIFLQKIFGGEAIGQRPELILALLFMVLGVQAASVGLLGEIIAFIHGRKRKEYTIEKKI